MEITISFTKIRLINFELVKNGNRTNLINQTILYNNYLYLVME